MTRARHKIELGAAGEGGAGVVGPFPQAQLTRGPNLIAAEREIALRSRAGGGRYWHGKRSLGRLKRSGADVFIQPGLESGVETGAEASAEEWAIGAADRERSPPTSLPLISIETLTSTCDGKRPSLSDQRRIDRSWCV